MIYTYIDLYVFPFVVQSIALYQLLYMEFLVAY